MRVCLKRDTIVLLRLSLVIGQVREAEIKKTALWGLFLRILRLVVLHDYLKSSLLCL